MKKEMTASGALEGSIQKWRDIRDGEGEDMGSVNCSLCQRFAECKACPVTDDKDRTGCPDTPYKDWVKHHNRGVATKANPISIHPDCLKCVEIAEEEVEFLKSLRPLVAEEPKHIYYRVGDGVKYAREREEGEMYGIVIESDGDRHMIRWLIGGELYCSTEVGDITPYDIKDIMTTIFKNAERAYPKKEEIENLEVQNGKLQDKVDAKNNEINGLKAENRNLNTRNRNLNTRLGRQIETIKRQQDRLTNALGALEGLNE